MIKDVHRAAIYGQTLTRSFDGLLDQYNKDQRTMKESAKQLQKISFAHPEIDTQLSMVIRLLETGRS